MKGFIEISKYAGIREDLVQASGGNTSVKLDHNRMCVKASGFHLYEVSEKDGYSLVDYSKICDYFEKTNLDEIDEISGKAILNDSVISGKRPSIETFFHSLAHKYVLHTHPVVVNVLTCRKDGMKVLSDLFPEALIIPYTTPGVELAKVYFEEYTTHKDSYSGIAFLQNHGLVVSADTAKEAIEKNEYVLKKIEAYLRVDYSEYHRQTELNAYFQDNIVWRVNDHDIITEFSKNKNLPAHGFCPDCIVFLGKSVLELPEAFSEQEINKFREEYGNPVVVNWYDSLYIIADSVRKAIDIQSVLSFSCKVMGYNQGESCNMLSDAEQNFLLGWEAEKYRQKL